MNKNKEYDVIVIGGGPSGVTAACAASREGAKTLLIEQSGCLGGMGTVGLVPCFCPFDNRKEMVYRGLGQEILFRMNKTMAHVPDDKSWWPPINPENLKRVYDDVCTENGVDILFFSFACDIKAENGEVQSILVANKSGLCEYEAKIYVDCSGDADIAVGAGCEYVLGDDGDGELQPATLCFSLSNVDDYAYLNGPNLCSDDPKSPVYDIVKSGKYPLLLDCHLCHTYVAPGTVGFNAGHIFDINPTDIKAVSDAMILGRRMAEEFLNALSEYHPKAFANAFVSATAPVLGIRESRRVVGDYILTVDDFLARRDFDNEIARNSYFIDVHPTLREQMSTQRSKNNRYAYEPGESHGIPYTCLTPKGIKNVLVAGKTISCEREVQGSVRVMPVCLATGEAAGIAAAMASVSGDIRAVDVLKLREKIVANGGYIH